MIQVRPYNTETDYDLLTGWWDSHRTVRPPQNVLPKLGSIAEDDGTPIAAVWLYMANCGAPVCFPVFHLTNPAIGHRLAAKGLSVAQEHLEFVAKSLGYGLMITMTQRPSMVRWLTRRNFTINHTGAFQLLKIL